jgi:ribosomal protein L11 methyltransferase
MKQRIEDFICIRCRIRPELEEELAEVFAPWGVLGAEIGEVTDQGVDIAVFLDCTEAEGGGEELCRELSNRGAEGIELGRLDSRDWLAEYRSRVSPFAVGSRWWIDPHPDCPTPAPPHRFRLVVEPRMAFGAGSHESTRAILEILEEMDVGGQRVLDVGTGSGILALAAEKLGAAFVVGLDIDPTAVWIASEIVSQQDWPSRVNLILGPIDSVREEQFDVVLCNMITSEFLPLAADLRRRIHPTGVVVFSGLLRTDIEAVSTALMSDELEVVDTHVLGQWAALTTKLAVVL